GTDSATASFSVNVFLNNIKVINTITIEEGSTEPIVITAAAPVSDNASAPQASVAVSLTRDPTSTGTAALSVAVFGNDNPPDSGAGSGVTPNFVPGADVSDPEVQTFSPIASFDVRTNNLDGDKDEATLTFTIPVSELGSEPLYLKFVNSAGKLVDVIGAD